jgi:hypothetical protein
MLADFINYFLIKLEMSLPNIYLVKLYEFATPNTFLNSAIFLFCEIFYPKILFLLLQLFGALFIIFELLLDKIKQSPSIFADGFRISLAHL